MKKAISLILFVLFILSSFSMITVSAKETDVISSEGAYSGTTGDCKWEFDTATGTLTISGDGKMDDYTMIDDEYDEDDEDNFYKKTPWYDYAYEIKVVKIENGVKNIGEYSFYECKNVISASIPNSVTSIGKYAFKNCSRLRSIDISNGVKFIGFCAFDDTAYYNDGTNWDNGVLYLGNYVLATNDVSGDYSIKDGTKLIADYAFSYSTNLLSIKIPNSVTSIGDGAFKGCTILPSIKIPNSVTSIGSNAFSYCTDLTSITVPNRLKSIDSRTFEGCTSLTSIKTQNSVKSIGEYAFNNCTNLKSITNLNSVKSIGKYAFNNCRNLQSITISNSVKSIERDTFENCKSLKNIYYTGNKRQFNDLIKNSYDSYFNKIVKKAKINISNTKDSGKEDKLKWSINTKTGILTISGKGEIYGSDYWIVIPWKTYLSDIKSVKIENGITGIGFGAFDNYNKLRSLTIPKSLNSIHYDFDDCDSLKDIYYSGNRRQFSCISGSSYLKSSIKIHCSTTKDSGKVGKLKWSVNTKKGVLTISGKGKMSNSKIPWSAYSPDVKTIKISNGITNIGKSAFSDFENIQKIKIPNSVKSIGFSAFSNCSRLNSVVIPKNVKSIGNYAFSSCSRLNSVVIPKNVKSIGKSAFSYCSKLKSVVIPKNVKSIGENTFYKCTSVKSIKIPKSVKSIGYEAFDNCDSVKDIYYTGSKNQWRSIKIDKTNKCLLYLNSQIKLHYNSK